MLQHVFETMNELLDEVIAQYPHAKGKQKQELDHQVSLLRSMSDHIVEEWLRFEERLSLLRPKAGKGSSVPVQPCPVKESKIAIPDYGDPYQRGQGYYLLMMYKEAVMFLEQAAKIQPENIEVRAYLAMSHLHLGNCQEAGHHFQLIIPLTDNNSMKAIACNALGCIHAKQHQFAQAEACFLKAHEWDPALPEPIMNLKVCQSKSGHFELGGEHMMHIQ
ncbi:MULTISPECIES: tetratricopeptide repeat protein [Paenibacillus]|uniref:Tetratricopeptide repeat protein n=3 Tax=Paenibacillus TaxID=44249 RepID=A0AAJ2JXI6_9BACL|nr:MULTISPECIES: tetratricopeptide repeat protein [Paenibacillus]EPY12384.1 hypothetical protein PAAL66ix_13151 [Paenibacillus alvei A6-6i-x]MCM3289803.1 tetratricopeptide repeat protein [Paenibacillus sp. MER 180]MCY9530615.1 tetratricopeptide repeat protein [Paenibacillus alvei]MDT8976132.1 tetratricopeptide repeat protein [Paenibacillus sp. chi10]TQR46841.1 tetratricopeptide repeat protein [Paenibacillus sp. SDF0028]